MNSYRDLRAWRESVDLAVAVYQLTEGFPRKEIYGLASQMRSAVVSISSNIAEGQGRETRGEWLQFLGHAQGSLYELETQTLIACRLGYLGRQQSVALQKLEKEVGQVLSGFIEWVRNRAESRKPQRKTENGKRKTQGTQP